MRILVISDIHGNIDRLNEVLDKEIFDRVFFLGDMSSYYGDYSDSEVRDRLVSLNAIMVMGNCDSYMSTLLDMPEVRNITINNTIFTLTHGHLYNEFNIPSSVGDVLLVGHTHIGKIINKNGLIIANPGSISKPRGCQASYIIIDDKTITLKGIEGNIIDKITYKKD